MALGTYAPFSMAQVFNDVNVEQQEGATVRVTIQFNAKVRIKRSVAAPSNDLATVFFEIPALDPTQRSVFSETRKWEGGGNVPAFTARYSSQSGQPQERRLDVDFKKPVRKIEIGPGLDEQTIVLTLTVAGAAPGNASAIVVAAPTAPSKPPAGLPPLSAPVSSAQSPADQEQALLLERARQAADSGQYEAAIAELNKLLNMPPGASSQDAQELVGLVRERLGEVQRAKAEYELYLKLYPDSQGAQRVQVRLNALALLAQPTPGQSATKRERKPTTTSWGGISQYYYGGKSKIRDEFEIISPATGATQIDTQNLSTTDQSSLVTDVNYNLRHRTAHWDSRFTFRDTFRHSFLESQSDRNRLSSAYVDVKNEEHNFGTRVGRQVAASGGVLGRFDGGIVTYGFGLKRFRFGLEGGKLVEPGLGGDKKFAGLTLDAENILENLGFEFFAIQQNAGSEVDRRAVGGELRYFDPRRSVFGLVDYDVMFDQLNIASVQGNLSVGKNVTLNFLYDYRRSPSLQMSNALLGQPESRLEQLTATKSREEIQAQAIGLTPVSKVTSLGATFAVSKKWQLGADYRISSVGATIATATLPASPATGRIKAWSAQAIGTGILTPSGVLVFNASYLTSMSYDAWLTGFSTRFRAGDHWTLEPGVKYYRQNNAAGSTSRRLAPVGRITYQLGEHVSLESEVNLERTQTNSLATRENAVSLFYYVGYRIDF